MTLKRCGLFVLCASGLILQATMTVHGNPVSDAVDDSRRTIADRERDAGRKPTDVLEFFGIQPGMVVLDIFSGGGYYTEILSYVVGEGGTVVALNNPPYAQFAKDQIEARFMDGRLPNVEQLIAENNQLELPANRFDAAILIISYHDIYWVSEESGWPEIDGPKMLAEIYQAMKPGAVFGIVDHNAEPGAPPETGGTIHRIDPALIKKDFAAAGFILDGEADFLRNPEDDLSTSVFDLSIRGETDRAVLRFRKPE